ncbi:AAA family ATPase [Aequorivita viscosa]|nr:AAA family ATPase [Aequorivita viscosa]
MQLPNNITPREELNLRLGIKCSLPKSNQLFAGLYAIYAVSDVSSLEYAEEYDNFGKITIKLKTALEGPITEFFQEQLDESAIEEAVLISNLNNTPLFKQHLESLQVALQLYWKLGEISFIADRANTAERTGGERYGKLLNFSTNLDVIDVVLKSDLVNVDKYAKNFLFNQLSGSNLDIGETEKKVSKLLTVFSEEAAFKIRQNGQETVFQQEGIYAYLSEGQKVIGRDEKEDVGPLRVLNSVVKDNLHFYLKYDGNDFALKDNIDEERISKYYERVNTSLNLSPKETSINIDNTTVNADDNIPLNLSKNMNNKIFYGAPGTGKSYKLDQILKSVPQEQKERITFHPDFDYASFVGGYKPVSVKKVDGSFDIQYKFVPQAFANIYVKAWQDIESENKYFLAIEEINRGNCAEIFGDIFQLLDRDANYTVTPSEEFQKHLEEELGAGHDGLKDGLKLPKNLYIYATMNTSDQSLFPMDSAFKRRWDWEYIPICYDEKTEEGKPNPSFSYSVQLDDNRSFSWNDFISKINTEHIQNQPTLGMDKCIGNYFIKPNADGVITLEAFVNKVLFYLWNDVFKDEKNEVFAENEAYESYFPIKSNGLNKLIELLKRIDVEIEEHPQNGQEEQQDEVIN